MDMLAERKSGLEELQAHRGLETSPSQPREKAKQALVCSLKTNYKTSAPLRMNITPVQMDASPGVMLMYTPSGQPCRRLALRGACQRAAAWSSARARHTTRQEDSAFGATAAPARHPTGAYWPCFAGKQRVWQTGVVARSFGPDGRGGSGLTKAERSAVPTFCGSITLPSPRNPSLHWRLAATGAQPSSDSGSPSFCRRPPIFGWLAYTSHEAAAPAITFWNDAMTRTYHFRRMDPSSQAQQLLRVSAARRRGRCRPNDQQHILTSVRLDVARAAYTSRSTSQASPHFQKKVTLCTAMSGERQRHWR